uniref:hypothetical protein n=1 Tax=Microbulbifer agarilyticus TaxID=260552 RepID=UPI000255ACC7|nr:hypothetical protein [Microbulbifer agarilyticus]
MQKRSPYTLSLLAAAVLVAGCVQTPVASPSDEQDGLVPRKTGLDSVSAAFAFDLSGAKVYLEPVAVEYTRRSPSAGSPLRPKDYELRNKDLVKLQALLGETLSERFLQPRQSELVADRAEADYVMQLDLSRFALGAPIDPMVSPWRSYTTQSAHGVLSGELTDTNGNPVMRFSDRRDIGENFGSLGPHGRLERFNNVTFWSDMRVDLRRAFASLNESLR